MYKYWALVILTVVFISAHSVSAANSTSGLQKFTPKQQSQVNPTDSIRRLTDTPHKPPLFIPSEDRRPFATPSGIIKRELTKMRLDAEKLKRCQALSKNIAKRSEKVVKTVVEMEKKFTSIIDGVKAYYIKNNLMLADYNERAASIETKKQTVASLILTSQKDVDAFSCTSDNPSVQLKIIDTDIRNVLKGLKEYRTEIHNLIEAIKNMSPTITPSIISVTP